MTYFNQTLTILQDEISEFASTCILNPPGPRDLATENARLVNGTTTTRPSQSSSTTSSKKRKSSLTADGDVTPAPKTKKEKGMNHHSCPR